MFVQFLTVTSSIDKTLTQDILKFRQATWDTNDLII